MKTIQIIGALLFVATTLSAQNSTFSFVKDNVHWVERFSTEDGDPEDIGSINPEYQLFHYSIKGETQINGITYKKVFRDDNCWVNVRQDENGIVYYCTEKAKVEQVLYHFNWDDPDYLHATDEYGEDFTMEALDSGEMVLADGNIYPYVKVQYWHPHYSHSKDLRFIRGVGLTQGLLEHIKRVEPDCYCYNDLVNLYDGDKLIYQNPLFTEQGEIATIISPVIAENNLSVLTYKGEAIFTLKNLSDKDKTLLSVYNEKGEELADKRMSQGSFALQNLPAGVYIYSLKVDTDLKEKGKFIITR